MAKKPSIDPAEKMRFFADRSEIAIKQMQENATAPTGSRPTRTYSMTEAIELIGRSATAIRRAESELGEAPRDERGHRYMTLEQINQFRAHFGTLPRRGKDDPVIRLGIPQFKGGVGKSATAAHLARYLAEKGLRVLGVDLDSQGSWTIVQGYVPDFDIDADSQTLWPIFENPDVPVPAVNLIQKTDWPGLYFVGANLVLYNSEFIVPARDEHPHGEHIGTYVDYFLSQVEHNFDVIIMDAPPSVGTLSINALYAANALLIPVPAAFLDFCSTSQFFSMTADLFETLPHDNLYFLKLMISKREANLTSEMMEGACRAVYGSDLLSGATERRTGVEQAMESMMTVYELPKARQQDTHRQARRSYDQVFAQVEELIYDQWEGMTGRSDR